MVLACMHVQLVPNIICPPWRITFYTKSTTDEIQKAASVVPLWRIAFTSLGRSVAGHGAIKKRP